MASSTASTSYAGSTRDSVSPPPSKRPRRGASSSSASVSRASPASSSSGTSDALVQCACHLSHRVTVAQPRGKRKRKSKALPARTASHAWETEAPVTTTVAKSLALTNKLIKAAPREYGLSDLRPHNAHYFGHSPQLRYVEYGARQRGWGIYPM